MWVSQPIWTYGGELTFATYTRGGVYLSPTLVTLWLLSALATRTLDTLGIALATLNESPWYSS